MKLLRRFSRGTLALISSIVLSGAVFTGCQTASEPTVFSDAPAAPVVAAPSVTPVTTRADAEKPVFLDVPPIPVPTVPGTTGSSVTNAVSVFHVGDGFTVTFSGVTDAPLPQDVEILGDGTITLPYVGSVKADGKTLGELQRDIYNLYTKYYKASSGFTVTVKPQARVYYIGGEVRTPGPKVYFTDITVTKAIQSAGDFTDFANKRNVELIRADGTRITVNCNKAIRHPELDPPVFPNDKIHVKRRLF